jgi:hypothetical protein
MHGDALVHLVHGGEHADDLGEPEPVRILRARDRRPFNSGVVTTMWGGRRRRE